MLNKMEFKLAFVLCIIGILINFSGLNAAKNCADPPKSIAPQECCDFPPLFKQNALDYCNETLKKGNQCFYECVYAATEICRHGRCDYRKVEDYIDWVGIEGYVFRDLYKMAYKDCMDQATKIDKKLEELKRNGCDLMPELLQLCVQNKMFSLCPVEHFKSNKTECTRERDYLENCILEA